MCVPSRIHAGSTVHGTVSTVEFDGSTSMNPPPPNAVLSCTWTITDGTGHFVGATGSGVCVDSQQLGDGRSRIGFNGWTRYDARNRSRD